MMRVKQAGLLSIVAAGLVLATAPGAWAGGAFLAAGPVPSPTSFDDAAAASGELAQARAGDFDVTSTIVTSQNQNTEQNGNSIGGDAPAGSVFVAEGATNGHGMGQYVVNTGNLGVAKGNMTMNIILNPAPAGP